ncbi:unannotated protein [freshwater metagenome]|uniref:Unannotated protein n=1 Tax=freshwater metagenome TaxID=449393 RepID=A0A6J7ARW4_9ZZZZ
MIRKVRDVVRDCTASTGLILVGALPLGVDRMLQPQNVDHDSQRQRSLDEACVDARGGHRHRRQQ